MRLALAAVLALALAAPAQASKASQWRALLAEQGITERSDAFELTPGRIAGSKVTVKLRAREQVSFSDNLYGATAWKWNGRAWRRVDDDDPRLTQIEQLAPGERAKVTLDLVRPHRTVRVLVPTTPRRAGRWVDV